MTIDLETKFQEVICHTLGATNIRSQELIQKLWSGYGRILRLQLTGSTTTSVIVKQIQTGNHQNHPRGWNSFHLTHFKPASTGLPTSTPPS